MTENIKQKPKKKRSERFTELLEMLDEMNKNFDNLPTHAQFSQVTQIDLNSALLLIAELFREQQG